MWSPQGPVQQYGERRLWFGFGLTFLRAARVARYETNQGFIPGDQSYSAAMEAKDRSHGDKVVTRV